jgi:hypothetical protein
MKTFQQRDVRDGCLTNSCFWTHLTQWNDVRFENKRTVNASEGCGVFCHLLSAMLFEKEE